MNTKTLSFNDDILELMYKLQSIPSYGAIISSDEYVFFRSDDKGQHNCRNGIAQCMVNTKLHIINIRYIRHNKFYYKKFLKDMYIHSIDYNFSNNFETLIFIDYKFTKIKNILDPLFGYTTLSLAKFVNKQLHGSDFVIIMEKMSKEYIKYLIQKSRANNFEIISMNRHNNEFILEYGTPNIIERNSKFMFMIMCGLICGRICYEIAKN